MAKARIGKVVVHLGTGKCFPSASAAARHFGVARSLVIENCLRKRATAANDVFRYHGDHKGGKKEVDRIKKARKRTSENRPIIRVRDNRVFQSNREARTHSKESKNTIFRDCQKPFGRFCYLDQWCPNPE